MSNLIKFPIKNIGQLRLGLINNAELDSHVIECDGKTTLLNRYLFKQIKQIAINQIAYLNEQVDKKVKKNK